MPQPAIQHGPDGLFVYVVGDDNKAKKQDVKVSEQNLTRGAGERGPVRRTEGHRRRAVARPGGRAGEAHRAARQRGIAGRAKAPAKAAGKMAEDAPVPLPDEEALTMADDQLSRPSREPLAARAQGRAPR